MEAILKSLGIKKNASKVSAKFWTIFQEQNGYFTVKLYPYREHKEANFSQSVSLR
jgi:hypothetical protein